MSARVLLTALLLACAVSGAIAAEDLVFTRLADLAVSKGDKDTQVGKVCSALGLPVKKDGSCLVYQALYKDQSGRLHSINVLNRAGRATRYVFFFLHDDPIGKAWLKRAIDALRAMSDGCFRHLPVVEDGRIWGIVSRGDFTAMEIDRLEEETHLWECIR